MQIYVEALYDKLKTVQAWAGTVCDIASSSTEQCQLLPCTFLTD